MGFFDKLKINRPSSLDEMKIELQMTGQELKNMKLT